MPKGYEASIAVCIYRYLECRACWYLLPLVAGVIIAAALASQALAIDLDCRSVTASQGRLQKDQPMHFCMKSQIYVAAIGTIGQETPLRLMAFLDAARHAGYDPQSVTFHSDGGNLRAAIQMGKTIRAIGLDTHVGKDSICASACMEAFIGGRSRKVTHNGRIGQHQYSSQYGIDTIENVQNKIAYLGEYYKSMQVSPLALTQSLTKTREEMYWYSQKEMSEWGIVTRR